MRFNLRARLNLLLCIGFLISLSASAVAQQYLDTLTTLYKYGVRGENIDIVDFNKDGNDDFLIGPFLYQGTQDGPEAWITFDPLWLITGVIERIILDIDNDGFQDIVVRHDQSLEVFLNEDGLGFSQREYVLNNDIKINRLFVFRYQNIEHLVYHHFDGTVRILSMVSGGLEDEIIGIHSNEEIWGFADIDGDGDDEIISRVSYSRTLTYQQIEQKEILLQKNDLITEDYDGLVAFEPEFNDTTIVFINEEFIYDQEVVRLYITYIIGLTVRKVDTLDVPVDPVQRSLWPVSVSDWNNDGRADLSTLLILTTLGPDLMLDKCGIGGPTQLLFSSQKEGYHMDFSIGHRWSKYLLSPTQKNYLYTHSHYMGGENRLVRFKIEKDTFYEDEILKDINKNYFTFQDSVHEVTVMLEASGRDWYHFDSRRNIREYYSCAAHEFWMVGVSEFDRGWIHRIQCDSIVESIRVSEHGLQSVLGYDLGYGNGNFSMIDINEDGWTDRIVPYGDSYFGGIKIKASIYDTISRRGQLDSYVYTDLNGDGQQELIIPNQIHEKLFFLHWPSTWDSTDFYFVLQNGNKYTSLYRNHFADINADGFEDIIYKAPELGDTSIIVHWGNSDLDYSSYDEIGLGDSDFSILTTGDFNCDGNTDLLIYQWFEYKIVSFEEVNGSLVPQITPILKTGNPISFAERIYLEVSDLDGDGDLDIIFSEEGVFRYYKNDCSMVNNDQQIQKDYGFQVWPNPIESNELHIDCGIVEGTYELFNIDGQKLRSGKLYKNGSLNVSDLAPGVYFIRVSSDHSQNISRQFIRI